MVNKKFPDEFMFASGFAAPQLEGGFKVDGKGISIPDCAEMIDQSNRKNHIQFNEKSVLKAVTCESIEKYPKRRGIDFFHTYKDDIPLIAGMGINALRFSIAWTRIYPNGEEAIPNEKGLEFYDNVLKIMKDYHIKPIVTICHYDMPINIVTKYGGWKNRDVIDMYVRYATTLLDRYHDIVKYWICFNQINLLHFEGFASVGIFKEGNPNYEADCYQAIHHQFIACAKVREYAKKHYPDIMIGTMLSDQMSIPYSNRSEDIILSMERNRYLGFFYGDVQIRGKYPCYMLKRFEELEIKLDIRENDKELLKNNTMQFLAISYYCTKCTNSDTDGLDPTRSTPNPHAPQTPWGWGMDTENMYRNLSEYYDRYQVPLIIAESGVGLLEEPDENLVVHDQIRINYYKGCLKSVKRALDTGTEVLAFCAWSPIDIVSSGSGEMSKRYGMIYVDQDDFGNGSLKRVPKDSYYWYKNIIASRGENLEDNDD